MRSFAHVEVESVEEACYLLGKYGRLARLNAGGTDLLSLLKGEVLPQYPRLLVNIKRIPHLDHIMEEDGVLRVGPLVRLREISESKLLRDKYHILSDAANSVATPQIRNIATIGGNLCQEVRCWYFRYPYDIGGPIMCARKGGEVCLAIKGDNRYHAIFGGRRCFAVCPSDMATVLAALDGEIIVANSHGQRAVPVTKFYHPMGTALKEDEMVTDIRIPALSGSERQAFIKFTLRRPIDFAIVSVAIVAIIQGGVCRHVRIALGGVAAGPVRAIRAEELVLNKTLEERLIESASEEALSEARPLSRNGYKIEVARALVRRALLTCLSSF